MVMFLVISKSKGTQLIDQIVPAGTSSYHNLSVYDYMSNVCVSGDFSVSGGFLNFINFLFE